MGKCESMGVRDSRWIEWGIDGGRSGKVAVGGVTGWGNGRVGEWESVESRWDEWESAGVKSERVAIGGLGEWLWEERRSGGGRIGEVEVGEWRLEEKGVGKWRGRVWGELCKRRERANYGECDKRGELYK